MRYGNRYGKAVADCLVCGTPLTVARSTRGYCSDGCRQHAYRTRQRAADIPAEPRRPRRVDSVYQCPECDSRYVGEQWCADCNRPCRRIGIGGSCPHCGEPVTVGDITG